MKNEIKGYYAQHLIVATSLRIALKDYFEHCRRIPEEIQIEQLPDKDYALDAHDELKARRFTIVVLSGALCEACINTWLALNLDQDDFARNEEKSVIWKWRDAPKSIINTYSFPDVINEDLKYVIDWRNAVMHTKAEVYDNEKEIIHKSDYGLLEELKHNRLEKIAGVTLELLENLAKFDTISAGIKNAGLIYSSVVGELAPYHLKENFHAPFARQSFTSTSPASP
jgi:hypothetical protein